jgi:hypothetical protein
MSEPDLSSNKPPQRRRNWDALAAIIASFIGFLALLVGGYTAYIQRYTADIQAEQVRAQVWPWLFAGNDDNTQSIVVANKGVGPAIVRSAQMLVDGKPQPDWSHVLQALDLPPHHFAQATLNPNVLSPGEEVQIIKFLDKDEYQRFKAAAINHLTTNICFCSTLLECWMYSDQHLVGYKAIAQLVKPVEQCPKLKPAEVFNN